MLALQERPHGTVVRMSLMESVGLGVRTGYELRASLREELDLSAFQFPQLQTGVGWVTPKAILGTVMILKLTFEGRGSVG